MNLINSCTNVIICEDGGCVPNSNYLAPEFQLIHHAVMVAVNLHISALNGHHQN